MDGAAIMIATSLMMVLNYVVLIFLIDFTF